MRIWRKNGRDRRSEGVADRRTGHRVFKERAVSVQGRCLIFSSAPRREAGRMIIRAAIFSENRGLSPIVSRVTPRWNVVLQDLTPRFVVYTVRPKTEAWFEAWDGLLAGYYLRV